MTSSYMQKLPTEEQCKELFNCCKIEYDINNYYDF